MGPVACLERELHHFAAIFPIPQLVELSQPPVLIFIKTCPLPVHSHHLLSFLFLGSISIECSLDVSQVVVEGASLHAPMLDENWW